MYGRGNSLTLAKAGAVWISGRYLQCFSQSLTDTKRTIRYLSPCFGTLKKHVVLTLSLTESGSRLSQRVVTSGSDYDSSTEGRAF